MIKFNIGSILQDIIVQLKLGIGSQKIWNVESKIGAKGFGKVNLCYKIQLLPPTSYSRLSHRDLNGEAPNKHG